MGAKSCAKSFHNQYGSLSGPGAVRFSFDKKLITVGSSMVGMYVHKYPIGIIIYPLPALTRFAPNGGKTKIIKYSFFSLLFLDDLSMMIYLDN